MKALFTKKNLIIAGSAIAVVGAIAAIILTKGKAAEAVAEIAENATDAVGDAAETVAETASEAVA